jgi:hypothetical protein
MAAMAFVDEWVAVLAGLTAPLEAATAALALANADAGIDARVDENAVVHTLTARREVLLELDARTLALLRDHPRSARRSPYNRIHTPLPPEASDQWVGADPAGLQRHRVACTRHWRRG